MTKSPILLANARPWLARAVARCAPLPPPILRVLSAVAEGDTSFEQLRPALDATADLRAKLLVIANSACYSPVAPIANVAHAASLVGQRMLLSLTLTHGLHPYLDLGVGCHGHNRNGLLVHSLAVATTAWAIADELGLAREAGAKCYIAGLFHDVGKRLLAERACITGIDLDLHATPEAAPGLVTLERQCLGIDHQDASMQLARHWQLGNDVVDLIAMHHAPTNTDPRAAILHLADHLTGARHGVGFGDGVPPETPLEPSSLDAFLGHPDLFCLAGQIALQETARAAVTIDMLF